jgi:hypothetical protein
MKCVSLLMKKRAVCKPVGMGKACKGIRQRINSGMTYILQDVMSRE